MLPQVEERDSHTTQNQTDCIAPCSLLEFTKTTNRRADSAVVRCAQRVRTTRHRLAAAVATPNAYSLTAEGKFTAERTKMPRVLRHLKLLGTLTGIGTIAGAIASHDTHLNGTLCHDDCVCVVETSSWLL
ncbi:large subunit ribosomal protein L37Ae [Trypanosoma cruzi]|nr:large subunit ribosomal protein L37Ae [Trypanosoma cruzi]